MDEKDPWPFGIIWGIIEGAWNVRPMRLTRCGDKKV